MPLETFCRQARARFMVSLVDFSLAVVWQCLILLLFFIVFADTTNNRVGTPCSVLRHQQVLTLQQNEKSSPFQKLYPKYSPYRQCTPVVQLLLTWLFQLICNTYKM
jgi:hypothetical protein